MIESWLAGEWVEEAPEQESLLPQGLAEMAPGPELGALLASVDRTALGGGDLLDVVAARSRQVSFEQAQLLADVYELTHTPARPAAVDVRTEEAGEFAAVEVAFALACTARSAQSLTGLAVAAIEDLPAVHQALAAGRIDLTKARAIVAELELLEAGQARAVLARLLPEVDQLTSGQIRDRLRRLVLTVDPEAVRRRYRKAVEQRCVDHDVYANGTAALSGMYLPKEKAAAAWDNIDRIAQATKAAGDGAGRGIGQIRADVFADLLAGIDPAQAGGTNPAPARGVINLHVEVATLMCLSEQPGQLDTFGPVLAEIARQIVTQTGATARWRFTATDHGEVIADGPLRYRPSATLTNRVRARDKTCRAPGCRRPAARCDLDHIHPYTQGGPTSAENMCCLCRHHHRAKHEGGYHTRRGALGIEWLTPHGAHYTVLDHPRSLSPLELRLDQHIHHRPRPTNLRH
ncbi:MAG: DUF222 domain-containing protein [Micromonosporaceae bacterium]